MGLEETVKKKITYDHFFLRRGIEVPQVRGRKRSFQVSGIHLLENCTVNRKYGVHTVLVSGTYLTYALTPGCSPS